MNNRKSWKRDDDEVKSAKKLIEEASSTPRTEAERLNRVELIPLDDEDGFVGLALALPEVLRQWGGRIREISLDSACKTKMLCHRNLLTWFREYKSLTI
jgi:hypothetical protein